ncbi:hypothetical protein MKW98_010867, partial [Papaver atlanticum]
EHEKEGKTIVFTQTKPDVTACGLDVPYVDLVIHCDLPSTSEIFLIGLVEQDVLERW